MNMFQSLIDWFTTLKLSAPHSTCEELSDGVAIAQALNQIAPEVFNDGWLSKIRIDVANNNWRLKMSNLKKVIEGVYDYYGDRLNYSLSDFRRPDAMRIAEKCDVNEMERLLQLVLGCAVNCPMKQEYIREIMCLEESLQQNIMRALQELESTWQGAGSGAASRNSLSLANFDNKALQDERDTLAQKCFDYEKKIILLIEEKTNFQHEIGKLQQTVERLESTANTIGDDGVSMGPVQAGSTRYNDLRRQMELLKEDLLQSETAREDLKMKTIQQQKEIEHMQVHADEMMKTLAELTLLKDEVDILRESNDKLKVCEAQLETYKKKLEEFNDLKKHVKMLEERSADYVQQNVQFEEDVKRYSTLKGQLELFKKEIQELHEKLDTEMGKNVRLEFENKNLDSNIAALHRSKESLLKERDNLREAIDELKCGQLSQAQGLSPNTMSRELQPSALGEKVQRLEVENKALREGQGGQTALVQLLDDANKRNENLREQLKIANERILAFSYAAQGTDGASKETELSKQIKQFIELNEQKTLQLEDATSQQVILQSKITQLESSLANREQELLICDTKYRKCVEKAKEVIKSLDPRISNVIDSSSVEKANESGDDVTNTKLCTEEDQLLTSAFYRLCVNTQRDAIDSKLALLMGQGQTFLARQRQSASRKAFSSLKGK